MKARIDTDGRLILTPESSTEEWALCEWESKNTIRVDNLTRDVNHVYAGPCLEVAKPFANALPMAETTIANRSLFATQQAYAQRSGSFGGTI